jgi:hypothetical protein
MQLAWLADWTRSSQIEEAKAERPRTGRLALCCSTIETAKPERPKSGRLARMPFHLTVPNQ